MVWIVRIEWTIDVLLVVRVFGNDRVFQLSAAWMDAHDTGVRDVPPELREQLRAVVRDELRGP
jgi:hypothetical protein